MCGKVHAQELSQSHMSDLNLLLFIQFIRSHKKFLKFLTLINYKCVCFIVKHVLCTLILMFITSCHLHLQLIDKCNTMKMYSVFKCNRWHLVLTGTQYLRIHIL